MAEYTYSVLQTVATNGNVLFTETPISGGNCIVHRDGSGLVTLRGMTNQCRARYRVSFGGNIAVPDGGTAGAISVALSVNGEPLASSTAIVTPTATAAFFNVSLDAYVDVPRGCFVPQPKVDSAVVRMVPYQTPPVDAGDEKLFFSLVKAAFGQRRKTLANALGTVLGGTLGKEGILDLISSCGFDTRIRGERLSLEDFALLSRTAKQRLDALKDR